MEPPKPPVTELPDLFDSGSSDRSTGQLPGAGHTLPSANVQSGPGAPQTPVAVLGPPPAPQSTMPSGQVAKAFRGAWPAIATLGGDLVEHSPPRLVRVRFPVNEHFANAFGVLAGGFVVAMFDAVVSLLAHASSGGRQFATLETSARFFRTIRSGHVVVDGTTVRAGRTTATIETFAWDATNELCAKAAATVMFLG